MTCGWLLLQAPELRLRGLAGPPEDSLKVPREGELLPPAAPPPMPMPMFAFGGADEGSVI